MILSGILNGPHETVSSSSSPVSPLALTQGKVLVGRISQVGSDGQGIIRFPNGSGFSFSGGYGLQVGEQVSLEVTRLAPEVTLRLVASESVAAANLAQSVEQSLMRAPDLLGKLMSLAGMTTDNQGTSTLLGTSRLVGLMAGKESLAGVLQKVLPNVSSEGLLKGDFLSLVRLLETGSRQEILDAVRNLRQAAATLQFDAPVVRQEESATLVVARNALQQVGDLLALQSVLPQVARPEDGSALLGYRLFWLTEGGLGEAIWWKEEEKKRREKKSGQDALLSVLLSLNMTRLGKVQARLTYGEGMLQVGIGAQEEEALVALRGSIGELRKSLLAAELPLRTLDLLKLGEGEMQAERVRALGVGSGFVAQA